MVGVFGQLCPSSPRHHPHLHGPANQCRHRQPQREQAEGAVALLVSTTTLSTTMSINYSLRKRKTLPRTIKGSSAVPFGEPFEEPFFSSM